MTCSSCGTDNEPGRKVCPECGTRLLAGGPACGAFQEARVAMTAAIVVGPDEPDGRTAADRAREILRELRATALADRFEAVLGEAWGSPSRSSRLAGPTADRATPSTSGEALESVG